MADTSIAPTPVRRRPEHYLAMGWIESGDVRELAYGLRVSTELAVLAFAGLREQETIGVPHEDIYELVAALVNIPALGAFNLAKELGALPEEVWPPDGDSAAGG